MHRLLHGAEIKALYKFRHTVAWCVKAWLQQCTGKGAMLHMLAALCTYAIFACMCVCIRTSCISHCMHVLPCNMGDTNC